MRTMCVVLSFAAAVAVYADDWVLLDSWPVPEVPGNPDNPDDPNWALGLAWKDDLIYVGRFNHEDAYPDPPFLTNLWIYDESGIYQGTQFNNDITDIDNAGVDWKGDADHGGVGWYLTDRRASGVYLVAEDGSSYASFSGPSNFGRTYGVAHNPDNDMLYVSDFSTGYIGWGPLDGSGHVASWTEESVVTFNSLKYVNVGRSNYLMALFRDPGQWNHALYIFTLNADGTPRDINVPDVFIDFADYFFYLGDFCWDGEYMWLLDQNSGGASGEDFVVKIDLPAFNEGIVNIEPTSLGNIKARFK